jgi:hypothetical protein
MNSGTFVEILPRGGIEKFVRAGEDRLDDELRSDDREYLIEMLLDEPGQCFSPTHLMNDLAHVASERDAGDLARVFWQTTASRHVVMIGIFPTWILQELKAFQSLEVFCFHTQRAFARLAEMTNKEKESARCVRFSTGLMRYLDILICSYEIHQRKRLSYGTLFALAHAGSKYAREVILPRTRH